VSVVLDASALVAIVARAEGFNVRPLPDSRGRTPRI